MTPQTAIQHRTALGLSKYAVAKALGCSRTHYHLWEKGERALGAVRLAKLEAILTGNSSK